MDTDLQFDRNPGAAIVILKAAGGFVPEDYAFLDEFPYFVLFGDGRFIRRWDDPRQRITSWKIGTLNSQRVEQIMEQISAYGFWEWDTKAIQSEIQKADLITDLPTTSITVRLSNRQKTFFAYGLRQYLEHRQMNNLKNPALVLDLLEKLPPALPFLPDEIEILVMDADRLVTPLQVEDVPWPLAVFPADEESLKTSAQRVSINDERIGPLVEILSRNSHFRYQGKQYLVRY